MSRRAKRTLAERVFLTAAASIVVAVGLLGALELIVWAPQRIESLKHDALQGDVDAAFTWGEMCSMTAGVNEDYAEAARWYRLAAEQGHAPSQERLASLYNHGQGVPLNNVEAYKWMDLAVAHSQGREQEHHSFYPGFPFWPSRHGQGTPIRGSDARPWFSSHGRCPVRPRFDLRRAIRQRG